MFSTTFRAREAPRRLPKIAKNAVKRGVFENEGSETTREASRPGRKDLYRYSEQKNGHETDLEMSPRPLGTTVFEEIYIWTMGKQSYSSEINLRLVYGHFYDHVEHHICRSAFGLQEAPGVKIRKNKKIRQKSAGNGVRHGNTLTIFMNIVRAFPCLTPFPAEFFGHFLFF